MNWILNITIDAPVLFLNFYYIGVAIALLIRDILWLRILLILAGASVITYGFLSHNMVVVAWNILFVSINSIQVIRLIIERKPIVIDDDILDLYLNVFGEMTRHEFLYFFKQGDIKEVQDELICEEGKVQSKLSLIIDGSVIIYKEKRELARLGRGYFVAEMGFITQKPASADVKADGTVRYISWSREKIQKMKRVYPDLANKLQLILAQDLVHKLTDHQ